MSCATHWFRSPNRNGKLFKDVWAARDAYIQVVLDRSDESSIVFLPRNSAHPLTDPRTRARTRADGDAAPRATDVHQLRLVL